MKKAMCFVRENVWLHIFVQFISLVLVVCLAIAADKPKKKTPSPKKPCVSDKTGLKKTPSPKKSHTSDKVGLGRDRLGEDELGRDELGRDRLGGSK